MTKSIRHLGIIMDGNRRWARNRGAPVFRGHEAGLKNAERIVRAAFARGIECVSLFAFSEENWQRPPKEVSYLLGLFRKALQENIARIKKDGVRVCFAGDLSAFPPDLRELALKLQENSTAYEHTLILCLGYSGKQEIVRMIQRVLRAEIAPSGLNVENIRNFLDVPNMPDLDLIIRTSGEQRLSGFLLFASAYSELYFSPVLWPDFTPLNLEEAIADFYTRERRHGK